MLTARSRAAVAAAARSARRRFPEADEGRLLAGLLAAWQEQLPEGQVEAAGEVARETFREMSGAPSISSGGR